MKNILTLAIAVAALALFSTLSTEQASAQGYNNGYLFGTGVNQSFGGRSNFQAPPYFAQFPPVYYSGIVRRPYGISPYAAPAGIEPVELRAIPAEEISPITISNPYMNKVESASGPKMETEKDTADETNNKTTWTKNKYFDHGEQEAVLAFFQSK